MAHNDQTDEREPYYGGYTRFELELEVSSDVSFNHLEHNMNLNKRPGLLKLLLDLYCLAKKKLLISTSSFNRFQILST